MKRLRIVFPVLSFALFCALSALLGALAGFICVLKFGADESPARAENPLGESVCAFLEDKNLSAQKFNPQGFGAEIEKILHDDFCARGVSVGEVLPPPEFEIDGGILRVKVCVNSPIAFFETIRTIAFYFRAYGGKLQMSGARLGAARLPLFAAKIVFRNISKRYLESAKLRACAEIFEGCAAKIEGGFLVLEK